MYIGFNLEQTLSILRCIYNSKDLHDIEFIKAICIKFNLNIEKLKQEWELEKVNK